MRRTGRWSWLDLRLHDTIARRFAVTIFAAIIVAHFVATWAPQLVGVLNKPSFREMGLLDTVNGVVRMVGAAGIADKTTLARAAGSEAFQVEWYAALSTVAVTLDTAGPLQPAKDLPVFDANGARRRIVFFDRQDRDPRLPGQFPLEIDHGQAYSLAVELGDASWLVFTAPTRFWGLEEPKRNGLVLLLVICTILTISVAATIQLSRPIRRFTKALRRFGNDPRATPVPLAGPRELRDSIRAFNAMQAQIQAFVTDRTAMLAAISHDLRTPLTKMRLRGEFIEDEDQRARLFRDVDDMQAMVDSALAFFRDDAQDEEVTAFDLPELLRTIADDFADQGHPVAYEGTDHLTLHGRPFALKRAFTNLVENAVKYGRLPELVLRYSTRETEIVVQDSGPGIPLDAVEQVFAPFYRLERSRNRATGGVGLGLTSARSVIQGHGGSIRLSNRRTGGLEAQVILPR